MKSSAQVSYTLLIAAVAVVAGSLGTLAIMSAQKNAPAKITSLTPPVLTLPSPTAPSTTTTPSSTPVATSPDTTQVSEFAQPVGVVNKQKTLTLADYTASLEETISDYWFRTYLTPRSGNSAITDVDIARWFNHASQISLPSSLAAWGKRFATPWNYGDFTLTFTNSTGSNFLNFGDTVRLRFIDGYNANIPKNEKANINWDAIKCAAGTPEDISVMANVFALAYPASAADSDICSHISTVSLESGQAGKATAYTLDTSFKPFANDSWGGGESVIYRPTILIRTAKKEDMIAALGLDHFALIEMSLNSTGTKKVSTLYSIGDAIVKLFPDIKMDNFCGYDSCY